MPICLKVHKSPGRLVVSLCDIDILGKKFEDKKAEIEVKKRFYEGKVLPEASMIKEIREATDINAVGKESVQFLIKKKLISASDVRKIAGVPVANLFTL